MSQEFLTSSTAKPSGGGCASYLVAFVLFLLTLSPVDLIPDPLLPLGLVDDLFYVVGAVKALRAARGK